MGPSNQHPGSSVGDTSPSRRRSSLAILALAALSCTRAPPEAPVRVEAAVATDVPSPELDTSADGPLPLAPIPPQPLFTNLTVPGFPDAVVALPNGANTPRPVLVILHGSGDRPDWNCDAWRHITRDYGFVLCPRGDYVPLQSGRGDDKRFTLRGGATLRRHLDAALAALASRFAGYVDVERPVVAGFSLGAAEAAGLAIDDPARFALVAELEGGHNTWTPASIRAFAAGGGQKVLFGCGSSWCLPAATPAAARLQRGGIEARVVHANVGHSTDRPLQEAIMVELGWFLAGDPRWGPSP